MHGPARHWQLPVGQVRTARVLPRPVNGPYTKSSYTATTHASTCYFCGVDRGHELVQGRDGEREVRIKIAYHQRILVGDQEERERREKEKQARQRGAWKRPHGAPPLSRMALGK